MLNKKQVCFGLLFLLAGALEYLFARPVGSVYFLTNLQAIHSLLQSMPDIYGKYGLFAPVFFHTIAFSLISMSIFSTRRARIVVCMFWFCIECFFEISQKYGFHIVTFIPESIKSISSFKIMENFFIKGRFDIYDLIAIGFGSIIALISGELLSRKGGIYERKDSKQRKFGCFANT